MIGQICKIVLLFFEIQLLSLTYMIINYIIRFIKFVKSIDPKVATG